MEAFLRDPSAETLAVSGEVTKKGSDPKVHEKSIGKREALAFYVHFIGDIHQPLHVGKRDDRGGNSIGVSWFKKPSNLHKVWDESLIGSLNLNFTELSTFLNRMTEEEKKQYSESTHLDWAKESKAIRSKVYDFGFQRKPFYNNVKEVPSLGWTIGTRAFQLCVSG